jgi:ABC-type antimicrobial peptide transport system permease subunit
MTAEAVVKEAPSFIYTEAIARYGEIDMILYPKDWVNPNGIDNYLNKTAIVAALKPVNGLEPAARFKWWVDFFVRDISNINLEKEKLVLNGDDTTTRF